MSVASTNVARGSLWVLLLCGAVMLSKPLWAETLIPPCSLDGASSPIPCGIIVLDTGSANIAEIVSNTGLTIKYLYRRVSAAAVTITHRARLLSLRNQTTVQLVPDRTIQLPDDLIDDIQADAKSQGNGNNNGVQVTPAGVRRIGAEPGLLPFNGQGVGVGILDTGMDFNHVDLAPGASCFDAFTGNCTDQHGHGTHVSGIVAALHNDTDVVGVAPQATPYAIKVLNDTGSGSDSTIMAGLEWVIANAQSLNPAIKVINMSFGRPGSVDDNPAMHSLIQSVTAMGITIVTSAGNDPSLEVFQRIPSAYPEVISTASSTAETGTNRCRSYAEPVGADTASVYTTDGFGVTITAPGSKTENVTKDCIRTGEGILSLAAGGGTTRKHGTSMAAPHVSGVVALLYQSQQYTDPSAIKVVVQTSASKIGVAPLDSTSNSYSFDGVREGVLSACGALGTICP